MSVNAVVQIPDHSLESVLDDVRRGYLSNASAELTRYLVHLYRQRGRYVLPESEVPDTAIALAVKGVCAALCTREVRIIGEKEYQELRRGIQTLRFEVPIT